jgi:quinoprotein dehydrogenase-associated probable ABC transporter substrate-binding protein
MTTASSTNGWRRLIAVAAIACLSCAAIRPIAAQEIEGESSSIELIDPHTLRVCADPNNLPLSSKTGEGFENKLAELFAHKLGKSVAYVWYPGSTGFVRNTLGSHRCDVIMGFPQGDDLAQTTNPYYRSAYALVFKQGQGLDDVQTLADPRLKSKRIGIVAGTPPANEMALNGLVAQAKSYPLVVDTRVDSSPQAMVHDIQSDVIDAGILWGPMAGYFAKKQDPPLRVVALVKETIGPKLAYRITMAVRPADQEFKRLLNRLIQENQVEINAILLNFGVPLLDDKDQLITQAAAK